MESNERRISLDLSYPRGSSVNDIVSKDFYLDKKVTLTYPGVVDLVTIVKMKGNACLLFKRDLKRAYRQIDIDISDSSLVGFSFCSYIYFDKVLSMGCRSSAFIMQRVSTSIKYVCNILNISIENYLDDLAGAEYPDRA